MNMQEQGFYDIYGMWYVPFWQRPWFLWTGVVIGVGIATLISWYVIRRYRARNKQRIPYWQEALNALGALKQQNIATVAQGSKFYAQLTVLLKQYLQQRYGFDVRGKTDDETIAVLERAQFNPQYLSQLKAILQGGLYIKFANMQAAQQQIEKDLTSAVNFVKTTIPS
jgi:hypothetical protein